MTFVSTSTPVARLVVSQLGMHGSKLHDKPNRIYDVLFFCQVVPTVERLCSELTPATSFADAAPMATDFRWIAIPLGVLISTGTVSRRRKLVYRIVKRDLGLGKLTDDGAGAGKGFGDHGLEHMEERWVAQVLLPALNHVGWHR